MSHRADGDAPAGDDLDVGALYADSAARVRRLVRHGVRAPHPVIEDACQIAWGRLVSRRSDVCPDRAVPWLVTTAVREAMRICRRERRDVSLEALLEQEGRPLAPTSAAAPDETLELRLQLDALRSLPERQQRLLWLQAAGLSYPEISRQTGATTRTIDRQLQRARRRLRG